MKKIQKSEGGMKPQDAKTGHRMFFCALWVLIAIPLLLCTGAEAYIYDDFSGPSIDPAKWIRVPYTPGTELFSQHDGRLYFYGDKGTEKMRSTRAFGPGFFTMEFHDFSSANLEAPGSHKGAFAALGLAVGDNFVRIIRCQNGKSATGEKYGVFEVNYMENNQIQVHYVSTTATEGQLGMYYDGSRVTFYYNTGLDPDNGWQSTGWKTASSPDGWGGEWNPNWGPGATPKLYIQGYDLTCTTSFSVDNVAYKPVPEPFSSLLLIPGLLGAGIAKRRLG